MKAAALILALAASSAQAQFLTGNELLERLNGSTVQQVNAVGYITGVADAELGTLWCPPPIISARQIVDLTKRTLDAVPEKRHENASSFVMAAVRMTWPCESKPKAKGAML
jgi:hypothetical protein